MADIAELWRFDLTVGSSSHPSRGACVMDAISWLEYGRLGDRPDIVCPIIAEVARTLNDLLPFGPRQKLKLFIPRMVGTNHSEDLERRFAYLVKLMKETYLRPNGLLVAPFHKRLRDQLIRILKAPLIASRDLAGDPKRMSPFRKVRALATADVCYRAAPFAPGELIPVDPRDVLFQLLDGLLSIGRPGAMPDVLRAHQRAEDFARARLEV